MRRPIRVLLLVSGCLLGTMAHTEVVEAAAYRIRFSGTPATGFSGNFLGLFDYDQACPGTSGVFAFKNTSYNRRIQYRIGLGTTPVTSYNTTDPFTITLTQVASGSPVQFQLQGRCPVGSVVTIVTPTTATTLATLPDGGVFPPTPSGATFKVTNLTGSTVYYSGTITALSYDLITSTPTALVIACYVVPQPCPQYVCLPRQSCFLPRFFRRRTCGW